MPIEKFFVTKEYDVRVNTKVLYDCYLPIVGSKAINLYIQIDAESQKQLLMVSSATMMGDFLKSLHISRQEFTEAMNKLQAMGLINAHIKYENDDTIHYFLINSPLSFEQFVANQKFKHLLIQCISLPNYEKLEFFYRPCRIPTEFVDITIPFSAVFNDEEVNKISMFNFEELYKKIIANTAIPVVFSPQVKNIIETFHNDYNVSTTEVERVVYQSIGEKQQGEFVVDADLLLFNLKKLVNSYNNVNNIKTITLNRNNKMFIENLSQNERFDIFNQYLILNSEQFLYAIIKHEIPEEQKNIIRHLRNHYCLSDYIINILIDFTLFKCNGNLNEKYAYKVANTINSLSLHTLDKFYAYIHNNTKSSATFINKSSDSDLWDR